MKAYQNFNLSEFDSPDEPGSGRNMKEEFMDKLQLARNIADIPFKINSGYRTITRNKKVGGVANSPHLGGWAADISATTSSERFKIVEAAIRAGFNRIGIASNFVHLDCDPNKPKDVIWTY